MAPSTRNILIAVAFLAVGLLSYAGGRQIRSMSAGPLVHQDKRLSALLDLGVSGSAAIDPSQPDTNDPDAVFQEVYRYVRSNYVERVTDTSKMSLGAVRAMVQSLDDPRTRLLDPEQYRAFLGELEGKYAGIGATLTVRKEKRGEIDHERLTVVAVAPGSPAEKAGLEPGDVISEIDGRWVIAYDPMLDLNRAQAQDLDNAAWRKARLDAIKRLTDGMLLTRALDVLSRAHKQAVKLTVNRAGASAPLQVEVGRVEETLDPVEYRRLSPGVGYLRVTQFGTRATSDFTRELAAHPGEAVVLDLRSNPGGPATDGPGGPLASAKQLVSLLAGPIRMGDVVRKGNRMEAVTAAAGRAPRKVAVLVNGGTANLAEMVAAALKEKGGARVVGARTFGDNVFQRIVPLRSGAALTIRAGKLLPPSGADFGGKGVTPHVALQTGGPSAADDAALDQAVSALRGS